MTDLGPDRQDQIAFMRLGHQCPFAGWFREQARGLATGLKLPFADIDLTGRPDIAAELGAYCPMQVAAPGGVLLAAPRPTEVLRQNLSGVGMAEGELSPQPRPPGGMALDVNAYRPGDSAWPAAVAATGRVCLGESTAAARGAEALADKRRWLEDLKRPEGPDPVIFLAGTPEEATAFCEFIPVWAAHVPLPAATPNELFLTCLHAGTNPGPAGDVRASLLEQALKGLEAASPPLQGAGGCWAVVGRRGPYPNGPLDMFLDAGFSKSADLGQIVLPGRGRDELILVHWRPASPQRSASHSAPC